MNKLGYIAIFSVGAVLLIGCEKSKRPIIDYVENIKIEEKEDVKFFETSTDFVISASLADEINKALKKARSKGICNVKITLVSNKLISDKVYERTTSQLRSMMRKNGFLDSRILDGGRCIYERKNSGIKISFLDYEITEPNTDDWDEYIGDINTSKQMPRYGVSAVYNLENMVANKADLIVPRNYKGQDVKAAISVFATQGGSASNDSADSNASSGKKS